MSSPYLPAKSGQIDGSAFQYENCVPAATVAAIDRATVGRTRTTPAKIRDASHDTDGGLTYGQAADAAQNVTGETLIPLHLDNRGELRDTLEAGRGAVVSIDTNVTASTTRRTNSFRGFHSVYANETEVVPNGGCRCEKKLTTQHREVAVDDPGTTAAGFLWWSFDLLCRAAERRTNNSGINVLATRDTEGITWVGAAKGRVRAEPDTNAKDLGPIEVGHAYPGGRTQNGGDWKRSNGTTANGWVHVKQSSGRWGWINGRRVKPR